MEPIQLFKALSDATRLRCIYLLTQADELCVCELTQALSLPQPKISHHLSNLKKSGLVVDRKEGLWSYYRINPELSLWAIQILEKFSNSINSEPFLQDKYRLTNTAKIACNSQ